MRTLYRRDGADACFVVTGLDEAYHQGARDLAFERVGRDFVRRFPADSAHIERIYANFARHAESLFAQRAGIRATPWEQALERFLSVVEPHDVEWWLVGSAALAVRGLAVTPGDVDLCVDGAGARWLGELLLDYLVEPVVPVTRWVCDWWGRAFMNARVEWIGSANERADTPHVSDFGPIAARRRETVYWRGHALRVPPLETQLAVNERRGRTERAEIIRAALQG